MRQFIEYYRLLLRSLSGLVPGRFLGLVDVDGVTYEMWRNDTVVLLPHVG